MSLVQKPEKLSSVCVAGALRDGVRAYTALHTHAHMAAGNTILVFDGASVCKTAIPIFTTCFSKMSVIMFSYFPLLTAFWPYLYPAGLLPWSASSDHITFGTKTHFPAATTTQCWYGTNIHIFCRIVILLYGFWKRSTGSANGVLEIILATAVKGKNTFDKIYCHHVDCAGIFTSSYFLCIRTQV